MLTNIDKRNALWNSISFICISLLAFINFSLNYNSYSPSEFGIFILINSIFGIGSTIDFGFGVSTVKYIAEAKKKEDYVLINKIFVSFFWSFLIFAVLIVILFTLYYLIFLRKSEIFSNIDIHTIDLLFILLLISFFFRYINNYMGRVFEGFAEFVLSSKISLFNALFGTFLMIIIFLFRFKIEYLAFAYLLTGIFSFTSLFIISLKKINHLKFSINYFSISTIKKYTLYSLNIQFSFFIYSFMDPIVKYLLGKSFNLNIITYYESAKKIIELTNGLIMSAQKGLLNKLSESNAINKLNEFINDSIFIYSKMSNYYSILLYGLANTILCVFVDYWFRSYETMIIFIIYLLPYSLINFAGCLYSVLMVEGKGVKLVIMQSINFVLVIALLIFSINVFNNYLGLIGYYLATIITISLLFYFLKKFNQFNIKLFISKVAFNDIIKLNVLVISELVILYLYKDLFYYILILYLIVFCLVFFRYLKYSIIVFIEKGKNIIQYI
jgi:O-antigen/teichoic acid export membrane protein